MLAIFLPKLSLISVSKLRNEYTQNHFFSHFVKISQKNIRLKADGDKCQVCYARDVMKQTFLKEENLMSNLSNQSTLVKILAVVGLLVVAGFVLNVVLGIAGGLIALFFRWGIPLLIAIWLVNWLTKSAKNKNRY